MNSRRSVAAALEILPCGDQRLPEAETAVASRQLRVREDRKTDRFEFANQRLKDEHVIERPAGQADSIERGFLAQQASEPGERFNQPAMEAPADGWRGHATPEVLDNRGE